MQGRHNLIPSNHRNEIEKYITAIIQNNGHKLLAIYCMPDHVHIMVGLRPQQAVSDIVRDIKANSSRFIRESGIKAGRFSWQEGYGAFSYSLDDIDAVIHYVRNQQSHHKKKTFQKEYLDLLREFNIKYDNKYLFEWIEAE